MALYALSGTGTTTTDLTQLGKGKRIANWHFSAVTAAATINLHNGTGGTVLIQIQLPIGASASQSYNPQGGAPLFTLGLSVEIIAAAGTVTGSVDLV